MAQVTISFSISAATPQDGAAALNAILNHPGDLHAQFGRVNHKLDAILEAIPLTAEERAELEAFRDTLPVMVSVSNQLNVFTPEA
jgi:hypothetical protein